MRIAFYLLTALGALGAWLSEHLLQKHIGFKWGGAADSGVCAGPSFSCKDAAESAMSEIGGLPVAALGLAFYATVVVLALAIRFGREKFPKAPDVLLLASAGSVLYSLVLGIYTFTVLERACPFCLGLYGVNAGLFATCWFAHPTRREEGLRPFRGLASAKAAWLALALMAGFTVAAQGFYANGARKAQATRLPAPELPTTKLDVQVGDAPGKGAPEGAPVVIVEFSDFQCPHCMRLAQNLAEVAAARPDELRYHFKHWPMDHACNPSIKKPFHENACNAARASECARRQGRFWEMHDRMFENRATLGPAELVGHARAAGLDPDRFEACMKDESSLEAVKADVAQGTALGVGATPTFFVNGFRQVGGLPAHMLNSLVDQAKMAAAKQGK